MSLSYSHFDSERSYFSIYIEIILKILLIIFSNKNVLKLETQPYLKLAFAPTNSN